MSGPLGAASEPVADESPPGEAAPPVAAGVAGSMGEAGLAGTPALSPAEPRAAESSGDMSAQPTAETLPVVTVSLTFDDTYGEQFEAAAILEAHGLRGTFYVNAPELHRATVSTNPRRPIDIAEALDMQARGHDIGGHTLGHLSLTDVPESERIREIAGDRAQLMQLGIEARSFAYPYGHVEDDDAALGRAVLEIARESGYTSARDTNGFELGDCARGPESRPPADPFILRSVRSVNEPPPGSDLLDPEDTAETLLSWLDATAGCGGGWLPLIFHHLSDDCSNPDDPESYCFDFAELDRLAAALTSGTRCPGGDETRCYALQVSTVSEAIGSTELAPAPEVSGLRNPSLERTLTSGQTECLQRTGASESAVFSRSDIANTGEFSERLEIAAPFEESAELGIERDYGACSIFTRAGGSYELSLHYRAAPESPAPELRLVTYRLTSDYDWEIWELGESFTADDPGEWVRRATTTSTVPTDTIAISFGLRLESAGTIDVDDFDSLPLGTLGAQ